jgi:origin recognition complex subunit 4
VTPERDASEECINIAPPSPLLPRLSRGPRKKHPLPIVEIPSPRKRKSTGGATGERPAKRVRTPLSKTEGNSNRATATPTPKAKSQASTAKGKEKAAELETPLRLEPIPQTQTPVSTTKSKPTPSRSARKPVGSLGSSVKTPLPTPTKPPLPNFDDAFLDESTPTLSRETFLANEALRRQREARNFVFEGDVNAVRATRSGRVVVPLPREEEGSGDEDDVEGRDEYGVAQEEETAIVGNGEVPLDLEVERLNVIPDVIFRSNPPTPSKPKTQKAVEIAPLPTGARRHVLNILSTLTCRDISTNPAPFVDEETNEALQGLVSLLRGTVERGEGNSGLIVGARGVGKTRVSFGWDT